MTPRKEVFKDPLIRIPVERIRFPDICPICGTKASRPARIAATPGKNRFLRPEWDPSFYPSVRRRYNLTQPETRTLLLHVCDYHYKSDEGDTNYKVFCIVGNGLLAAAFIFSLFSIGGDLWMGMTPDAIPLMILGFFPLSLLITIFAFRAGPLASSVKIIGFDSGFQNVWLQFKRADYREAFMEENAMSAELVSWIVRS